MAEQKGVEAVDRALKILECFSSEAPEISLADLSRQTGFYKSTILRLAVSLERFGYLTRAETGLFRLGPATWRLGSCYQQGFDLAEILRPELKALSADANETASLYVREGNARVCLYREEPLRSIRYSIVEGSSLPLDRGAPGKILMAFAGEDIEGAADIRRDGFAISLGERDPEVASASVPLIASGGRLVGALAISGLISRFDEARQEVLLDALKASAERLSRKLTS